ncbi:Dipeptidyl aminopeptidase/acylaminoacyl-peptidase [Minicystis rosea]|nr:Dipeptidyl aminopeptidase/acylaminoacyl-peptidase [Minicystis rosea]
MMNGMMRLAKTACLSAALAGSACKLPEESPPGTGGGSTATTSTVGTGGATTSSGVGGATTSSGTGGTNAVGSRCAASPEEVYCPYEVQSLPGKLGIMRDVMWQVPLGTPPAAGWPVVLLFQGSFYGPPLMFDGPAGGPHGVYHLALTIKSLLDAGYAVLAPAAHVEGGLFWDTNVPPWSIDWTDAPDNVFMQAIFAAIPTGKMGPLDASRLYATGISSGGYMTSRMAVSYPGKFRALAVHSGSYATCSGPICLLPDTLPSDHPPTLFLHGEIDLVVPINTMKAYATLLQTEGKETRVVTNPTAGHEWLSVGPKEVVAWFDAHP